uniref:Uncharacterized protein n=1 Tax=Arundo donax TaxID=35708 RepID=A0A0A9BWA3_ARUDO
MVSSSSSSSTTFKSKNKFRGSMPAWREWWGRRGENGDRRRP